MTDKIKVSGNGHGVKMADNIVLPFRLERPLIRGRLVRLGSAVNDIMEAHQYPDLVGQLLSETITLAVALSDMLKYDGVFYLQTKSDGAIHMLVSDVTSEGNIRGYCGFDEAKLAQLSSGKQTNLANYNLKELLGNGHLAFTVDQGPSVDRYQGIVDLAGKTLADSVYHYFAQSEQLQTSLMLAAEKKDGAWRAGAIMLQRLPPDADASRILVNAEEMEEDWNRSNILLNSVTKDELIDPTITAQELLLRLFHEEGVRVYDAEKLQAKCRCSEERVLKTLRGFPAEELQDMQIEGKILVTCEFCSQKYAFDFAEFLKNSGGTQ